MTVAKVAQRFLTAVYEGDTDLIWNLLSNDAREFVVGRGTRKGLDADLGRSLLDGTADDMERAEFLGDLLSGLQRDLEAVDLSRVHVAAPETAAKGQAMVVVYEEFIVAVGPPLDPLPVGSIELVEVDGTWKVQRLAPGPPVPNP